MRPYVAQYYKQSKSSRSRPAHASRHTSPVKARIKTIKEITPSISFKASGNTKYAPLTQETALPR
jgi:hypothetical protein